MWGAEDLIVSLGGRSSRREDGSYLDIALHARSSVLIAAGAVGKSALDSVYLAIDDESGLEVEARDAATSGFTGKACIHPHQAAIVRRAFKPSPEQVAWARRVIESVADSGVSLVDGHMVDEPLLRQAHSICRADRDTSPTDV
jgi:citrate lyase subunit beta/citryl-CoA lyase